MNVAFRVDAARHIGTGHVARCLTLAQELRRRGASVSFIVRDHEPGWYRQVDAAGVRVVSLPRPPSNARISLQDHRTWAGVPEGIDAEQTLNVLRHAPHHLLIVDHYGLGLGWERKVGRSVERMVAIDDLPDRVHDVDILIDQNLTASQRHASEVFARRGGQALLGPRYALLNPSYLHARELGSNEDRRDQRVLVYFGGSDPAGLTRLTIEVLGEERFRHLQVDVVLGPATKDAEAIRAMAVVDERLRVHTQLPSLAGLLMHANVAVGAGGATTWERACLAVPSIVVAVAANQLVNARLLQDAGAARYVGTVDAATRDRVREALISLVANERARRGMAEAAARLVDGWGVWRATEVLLPSSVAALRVQPAAPVGGGPELVPERSADFKLLVNDLPVGAATLSCGERFNEVELELDPVIRGRHWETEVVWKVDAAHRSLVSRSTDDRAQRLPLRFSDNRRHLATDGLQIAVVSDASSWLNPSLVELTGWWLKQGHAVAWCHDQAEIADSDVCFYLDDEGASSRETQARHRYNLTVRACAQEDGHACWPITRPSPPGRASIRLDLMGAEPGTEHQPIYAQQQIDSAGHELADHLRARQGEVLLKLCRWAVDNLHQLDRYARPPQDDPGPFPQPWPEDNQLDPHASIAEQFDLLRAADNDRCPAYFDHLGHRYRVAISLDDPLERR